MKVRSAIARMKAYNPPLEGRVERDYLLLDFSESTQPPPPHVAEALKAYIDSGRLRIYPAYGGFQEQLAAYAGVRPEQLLLTNGSDSAIQLITHALLGEGDEMVMARPGFFVTEACALSAGAKVVAPEYPRADMAFPLEGVLAAVTPRTRLIVVVSPNNPTGTTASGEQIETILRTHPDVPVMVDEAYYEFSGKTAVPLLARHDNLAITRTCSKAFALAGLRLGYALSNAAFIAELHKVRIPYDVNSLAVVAAQAQLERPDGWRAYVDEVMQRAKPMVERFLREHGVFFYPSEANFLLLRPDDAQAAAAYLKEHDILVRPQRPPVADCFRMSIGTVAEMQRFMEVWSRYPGVRRAAAHAG
ncbi:MAG TPA: aminotransferase class I/II-fold pyridoxal phosphate-dependent enzyme [bacterium]|jgi:histidinol-phosphate aminotransferase